MDEFNNDFDYLQLRENNMFKHFFDKKEYILFTAKLTKINEKDKKQTRNFMITNFNIFNLDEHKITRKTQINQIYAIIISQTSNEFTIHVPQEYDYRYESSEYRDKAILMLLNARKKMFIGGSLPLYEFEQPQLKDFTTTKIDKKKGIVRFPQSNPILINEQLWLAKIGYQCTSPTQFEQSLPKTSHSPQKISLSDFKILSVLGKGGFGEVYLIERKEDDKLYALKVINKERVLKNIDSIINERRALTICNHPFLLNLELAFQSSSKLFFVTQFLKGGELNNLLKKHVRFQENIVRFLTAEIILGLEFLHKNGIVYRDLKLSNILVDEEGHLKLVDFGLSKFLSSSSDKTNTLCGTPHYVAPEVLKQIGYSFSADWWSLGICVFQMLYGQFPFHSNNINNLFQLITDSKIQFPIVPDDVSPDAKNIIKNLLEKNSQNRLGIDIKKHQWFKGFDFNEILTQNQASPLKQLMNHENWLENFDQKIVLSNIPGSFYENDILQFEEGLFKDFEYIKIHN